VNPRLFASRVICNTHGLDLEPEDLAVIGTIVYHSEADRYQAIVDRLHTTDQAERWRVIFSCEENGHYRAELFFTLTAAQESARLWTDRPMSELVAGVHPLRCA